MLRLATLDAARAWHLDHEVGSLTPGKQADVTVVDMRTELIGVDMVDIRAEQAELVQRRHRPGKPAMPTWTEIGSPSSRAKTKSFRVASGVVNAGPRSAMPIRSRPLIPSGKCSACARRASVGCCGAGMPKNARPPRRFNELRRLRSTPGTHGHFRTP